MWFHSLLNNYLIRGVFVNYDTLICRLACCMYTVTLAMQVSDINAENLNPSSLHNTKALEALILSLKIKVFISIIKHSTLIIIAAVNH